MVHLGVDQYFWSFGGMRQKIKESSNAATGVEDGRERGVGVNPETHVTGDVPNDDVGECGDEIKDFLLRQGFLRSPSLGRS